MSDNQMLIEKTIETSTLLDGGVLNAVQQNQFIVFVKQYSKLLNMARFVRMPTPSMQIEKMHVSEPVTRSGSENTIVVDSGSARFNQVELSAKKLTSAWNVTTETFQSNIERDDFEMTMFDAMTKRIATDMELLAINGDSSISATTPTGLLLKTFDGWDKQSDNAHIIDADAATIDKNMFTAALRRMPKQFRTDPGIQWLVSDTIATDWLNLLAERGTRVGDNALGGKSLAPFGRDLVMLPLIPDDQVISVTAATPGYVAGTLYGPFVITTANNQITIADGVVTTKTDITIPAGTWDATVIVALLNQALQAGTPTKVVASTTAEGLIDFTSTETGATTAARVTITAGTADMAVTLGVATGNHDGNAAGSGSVAEGSFMWLTNPKNFVVGVLDKTRIYSKFNQEYDRIESVIYNQMDVKIENYDALVKVINIRAQTLL